jgi:Flp pilus assembly protein TadG
MRLNHHPRKGVTTVECAVIYPAVLLLLLGILVGGWGVFRYQELSSLARRAARYAAVHGAQWAKDTNNTPLTAKDIYDKAIAPYAVGLDSTRVTYSVTYNTDSYPSHVAIVKGNVISIANTVTVTLNYRWLPEAFLSETKLSSTSVVPMSY